MEEEEAKEMSKVDRALHVSLELPTLPERLASYPMLKWNPFSALGAETGQRLALLVSSSPSRVRNKLHLAYQFNVSLLLDFAF